jgi:aminoglycoside phosphotransferase (APT) family kinase protein
VNVDGWELSGYGDPFFDLATMPYALGFTPEKEDHWLRSYFGTCEESLRKTLQDLKFDGLIREVSWALFHAASEPDPVNHAIDYAGFARRVIQCLDEGRLNLAS